MVASDAGAWARLRLVQGDSATSHWEFGGTTRETRLTVGSNPSCQWVLNDPTVEPFHLVFLWDGQTLSLAGSREGVALSLDGQPIGTTFVRVGARARVELGRCALVAETASAPAPRRRPTISSAPPPPVSPGPPPSSSHPRAAHSSRPPKSTVMGVAALTDSTPPTRVRQATPPPSGRPQSVSGPTAVGIPPVPERAPGQGSEPPARSAQGSASGMPRLGSDRPIGSTLYGIGGGVEQVRSDVVSSARLRRSSIPPGGQPAEDPGRVTEPGYPEAARDGQAGREQRADPTPTDTRLIDDAQQLRALSSRPQAETPGRDRPAMRPPEAWVEPGSGEVERPAPAGVPAEGAAGSEAPAASPAAAEGSTPGAGTGPRPQPAASERPRPMMRPSGPPPATRPSTLAIALALAAVAGLGVWVYAVFTL